MTYSILFREAHNLMGFLDNVTGSWGSSLEEQISAWWPHISPSLCKTNYSVLS